MSSLLLPFPLGHIAEDVLFHNLIVPATCRRAIDEMSCRSAKKSTMAAKISLARNSTAQSRTEELTCNFVPTT